MGEAEVRGEAEAEGQVRGEAEAEGQVRREAEAEGQVRREAEAEGQVRLKAEAGQEAAWAMLAWCLWHLRCALCYDSNSFHTLPRL